MRHPSPRRAALDQIAQAIEDLAQRVFPLSHIFGQQRQVAGDKRPFFVAHITGIGFASTHPRILSPYQRQILNRLYADIGEGPMPIMDCLMVNRALVG
jgi:hypothetical protein